MTVWVERPPGPDGTPRGRTFEADYWRRGPGGYLEVMRTRARGEGDLLVAEIAPGDWTLAEAVDA